MTLRIGVLTVRGRDYHPTARLAQAAVTRSCEIFPINPYEVQPAYRQNRPILNGDLKAATVQAVLPRQGAEIKTACLPLILHYEQMGICVINGWRSIQMARNKFFMIQAMSQAGLPVPNTIFAASMKSVRQARQLFAPHPSVLKPINGRQGTGLHCLSPEADLPKDITPQITAGRGILIQALISARHRRDYRLFVLGREVVGAVTLKPPEGDFRANIHVGGQSAPVKISSMLADLAVRAAAAMELEIAGVDLIVEGNGDPKIIEVNSAPGFRGLEQATGKDIAGAIIDYTLSKIKG